MITSMKKDRDVQFKLRLPASLLAEITECAERSGLSIGAEINRTLTDTYDHIANTIIRNRHSELAIIEIQITDARAAIGFVETKLRDEDHSVEHRAEGERLLAAHRKDLANLLESRDEIQRQLEWASGS